MLHVDWRAVNGACRKKRILHLKNNTDGLFCCPITTCLHMGFKSQHGLRKHIDSDHCWYYYFNEQPTLNRDEVKEKEKERAKCSTFKMPAFSLQDGMGHDYLRWLGTPCGGGKCNREALQIGRRAMKFLKASMGEQQEDTVSEGYADCCLGSPCVIMNFLKMITEQWEMTSSGALNYMKAIGDLMDFRKSSGVSDEVLRSFAVSEVYIRRGKENLSKRKRMHYARNLDLEQLIARDSWASMDEMENVIPFHTRRYQEILCVCKESDANPTISQLAFATRFIVTFLFLRVKCTRPMSYQYLTLKMFEEAKENGGFIDQTAFKTHEKYAFDTLILTDSVLQILETYKTHVRPLCNPACDFFVITTNGTQYTAFCTAMSLLVHEAIGKYVNPTRYRQIVETESTERLTDKERDTISRDQKHSSYVAKRVYQKKTSREVAVNGKACMQKIVGKGRDEHTNAVASSLTEVMSSSKSSTRMKGPCTSNVTHRADADGHSSCSSSLRTEVMEKIDTVLDDAEVTIDETPPKEAIVEIQDDNTEPERESARDAHADESQRAEASPPNIDIEVKREEAEDAARRGGSIKRFTVTEDGYLKKGVTKYGKSSWSKILQDTDYTFTPTRNRDSLRMRAKTLGLLKKPKK